MIEAACERFLERGWAGTTMRSIAQAAGVSVPTVEQQFGTKAELLRAAIDVAIAGDDEPVAVLDRPWVDAAVAASTVGELMATIGPVLGAAQERSAGLVLAAFEGSTRDGALSELSAQLITQRERTAAWIVARVEAIAELRADLRTAEAVDTVWLLMDPAVFDRLTRHRSWTTGAYQRWFATSLERLLVGSDPGAPGVATRGGADATTPVGAHRSTHEEDL